MILVGLLVVAWRVLSPSEVLLPEAPEILAGLGRAAGIAARWFTGLASYLTNKQTQADLAALQDQVNVLEAGWEATTSVTAHIFDNVAKAWVASAEDLRVTAKRIEAIGVNDRFMWHRLRHTVMPNTLRLVYWNVWSRWIFALQLGLDNTVTWAFRWHLWTQQFVTDLRQYTRQVQETGRHWRAAYIYPQIYYLLHPWRVAWNYTPAFLTGISHYLPRREYRRPRDAIARTLFHTFSGLWQVLDRELAAWLQTDVSRNGWGAEAPTFPQGARVAPPIRHRGIWEPFTPQPNEPAHPKWAPRTFTLDRFE